MPEPVRHTPRSPKQNKIYTSEQPPREQVAKELSNSPALAQAHPEPQNQPRVTLLASKLTPPRLPLSLVRRSRLLDESEAIVCHPLTLVSASAGSGKTTLLAVWMAALAQEDELAGRGGERKGKSSEAASPAVAWLALDPLDDTATHFWSSVIAALRTAVPEIGQVALALLHALEESSLAVILTHLLCEIEQVGKEVVLILDDYHLISEQSITDSMLFLLDHIPANLHLVFATRTDPELPLARLRVRSQLVEIRDEELRFTEEEAASFLREGMNLPLEASEVSILHQRTEGWIAGLQLAALAMRKRENLGAYIKDFAGNYRYLVDYVQQEILARLPTAMQDFLLQTSILSRMDACLCQTVTQTESRQASQHMLEELERANLFVVPLDEQRQWYRYHDLFREVLQTRLRAAQPESVPLLHQRAARAYEAAGELREAIAHALAAPDYPYAADLMKKAAPHFWLSGEGRTIYNWVLALPDSALPAYLHLALDAALRFLYSAPIFYARPDCDGIGQTLTRIERLLQRSAEFSLAEEEVALLARRTYLLRSYFETRATLDSKGHRHLMPSVKELEALPADEEECWNLIPLSFANWLTTYGSENNPSLIQRMQITRQRLLQAGDYPSAIRVITALLQKYLFTGQLYVMREQCLQALKLIEENGISTIMTGYLYLNLFHASYAQNRLQEAADWLAQCLRVAHTWQEPHLLTLGEIFSVQLALARSDLETARQAMQRMEAIAAREGFTPFTLWDLLIQVDYWLASGNLAQAKAWAEERTFPLDGWTVEYREEALRFMKVLFAEQQYAQAIETLARFHPHLESHEDTIIPSLALSLVALYHAGTREETRQVAARLFALTEPEENIRVYLDLRQPMQEALAGLLDEDETGLADFRPFMTTLLAFFEQEEKLCALPTPSRRDGPHVEPQVSPSENAPIILLTRQEMKVLRLLAAGQTYAEMAESLVVSLNTIKTQVSSIYSKLGASRRVEAIVAAQRLHLL